MKHIDNLFNKIKSKEGNFTFVEIVFMIFISFVIIVFCIAQFTIKRSISKDIFKADSIVSNYGLIIEKKGYLSDSDRAKLSYELKELGFSEVEVIAPKNKEEDSKNIALSVTVKNKNRYGGEIFSHNFLREIRE